jgi:Flp pilus assembly protein TadG
MARAFRILSTARRLRDIRKDEHGATIVEFALILPSMLIMLMGALDYGHTLYMEGVLQGAVQKAGRDGTLQTSAGSDDAQRYAIDTMVQNQLKTLHKGATVTITLRFYRTFTYAASQAAETFTDTNQDGICDNNEPFNDVNNNGVRDTDGADSVDHAGARDNVVYTVTVTYPRMFPINKLIGGSGTTTLTATTVLSNQPYGDQAAYGAATVGHCP